MLGRAVRVPPELTSDPFDKRGEIGTIIVADRKLDTITVRFDDGITGDYAFNALETLYPNKALLYNLNAKWRELDKAQRETIKQVINLASKRESRAALLLACTDTVVKNFCVTDTESFYGLKKNPRKQLGLS